MEYSTEQWEHQMSQLREQKFQKLRCKVKKKTHHCSDTMIQYEL